MLITDGYIAYFDYRIFGFKLAAHLFIGPGDLNSIFYARHSQKKIWINRAFVIQNANGDPFTSRYRTSRAAHFFNGSYNVIEYAKLDDPKKLKGKFTVFLRENVDFAGAGIVVDVVDKDTATVSITGNSKTGDKIDLKLTYRRK